MQVGVNATEGLIDSIGGYTHDLFNSQLNKYGEKEHRREIINDIINDFESVLRELHEGLKKRRERIYYNIIDRNISEEEREKRYTEYRKLGIPVDEMKDMSEEVFLEYNENVWKVEDAKKIAYVEELWGKASQQIDSDNIQEAEYDRNQRKKMRREKLKWVVLGVAVIASIIAAVSAFYVFGVLSPATLVFASLPLVSFSYSVVQAVKRLCVKVEKKYQEKKKLRYDMRKERKNLKMVKNMSTFLLDCKNNPYATCREVEDGIREKINAKIKLKNQSVISKVMTKVKGFFEDKFKKYTDGKDGNGKSESSAKLMNGLKDALMKIADSKDKGAAGKANGSGKGKGVLTKIVKGVKVADYIYGFVKKEAGKDGMFANMKNGNKYDSVKGDSVKGGNVDKKVVDESLHSFWDKVDKIVKGANKNINGVKFNRDNLDRGKENLSKGDNRDIHARMAGLGFNTVQDIFDKVLRGNGLADRGLFNKVDAKIGMSTDKLQNEVRDMAQDYRTELLGFKKDMANWSRNLFKDIDHLVLNKNHSVANAFNTEVDKAEYANVRGGAGNILSAAISKGGFKAEKFRSGKGDKDNFTVFNEFIKNNKNNKRDGKGGGVGFGK